MFSCSTLAMKFTLRALYVVYIRRSTRGSGHNLSSLMSQSVECKTGLGDADELAA